MSFDRFLAVVFPVSGTLNSGTVPRLTRIRNILSAFSMSGLETVALGTGSLANFSSSVLDRGIKSAYTTARFLYKK